MRTVNLLGFVMLLFLIGPNNVNDDSIYNTVGWLVPLRFKHNEIFVIFTHNLDTKQHTI